MNMGAHDYSMEQPAPVSATEPEFPATFLFAPSSSEPKMLPAVAWLREEADTWSAFKGDEPDEPNTARTLNGIADYITTLRARLVEAERVTEATRDTVREEFKQILCDDTSSYPRIIYPSNDVCDEIVRLRAALTAARGGG